MRIQEVRHENEPWLMYWLGNLLSIDSDYVRSVGIAWLFKEDGKWVLVPRITGNTALFYNSVFFVRLTTLGLFWSIRWSSSQSRIAIFQTGLGFKLNGRFAPLFRFQSDDSSAAGVTGKNTGQAHGFEYGTH